MTNEKHLEKYLYLAARSGEPHALCKLASIYIASEMPIEGAVLYKIAARSGFEGAIGNLEKLIKKEGFSERKIEIMAEEMIKTGRIEFLQNPTEHSMEKSVSVTESDIKSANLTRVRHQMLDM